MPIPFHHIFVCQNERAEGNPKGCCKARGSEALMKAFKHEIKAQGLRHALEADGSTCLDTCAWGPTVVVYPENVWYGKVTPEDVPEILEAIQHGTVVKRLLVPDEAIRQS
jgi:(2Fe-2S) ferredoxin